MLCLMESQLMRSIIDAKFDRPDSKSIKIIKQYDSLLKGWIYGSQNEEVHKNVVGCESTRDVWANLESFYDPKIGSAPPLSTYVFLLEVSEADSGHLPLSRYSDSCVQIGVNFLITAIFSKKFSIDFNQHIS
nr:ankyrin repeat-containing protein [Tanacetum cinerariifolium]